CHSPASLGAANPAKPVCTPQRRTPRSWTSFSVCADATLAVIASAETPRSAVSNFFMPTYPFLFFQDSETVLSRYGSRLSLTRAGQRAQRTSCSSHSRPHRRRLFKLGQVPIHLPARLIIA